MSLNFESSLADDSYLNEDGPSLYTDDIGPAPIEYEQTVLAICTASSRSGCAIYHDSTIKLVADRTDSGDPHRGIDVIIQRIDPDIVIIAGASTKLFNYLDKIFQFNIVDLHRGNKSMNDVVDPAFSLVIVPNSWFAISYGESRLVDSDWAKNRGLIDVEERSLFVNSRINKSVDVCAIRSVSAIDKFFKYNHTAEKNLVTQTQNQAQTQSQSSSANCRRLLAMSQLTRTTAVSEDHSDDRYMPIVNVGYIDPGPVVSIDKFTFQTLGAFPTNKTKIKQQLTDTRYFDQPNTTTIFDLLNQCQSLQGKKTMQTIMTWPITDPLELKYRYETVDYFSKNENRLFREQLMIQLKNMVPLAGILTKLHQSTGGYKELSIVYKSLWAFVAVLDLIKANDCSDLEILRRILCLDSAELRVSIDSIINVIDFEASKREQRIQVCMGVDQSVDEKKEVIKNLTRYCDEVAAAETAKYRDILNKPCRVLYIPRIGFLNSVQYSSSGELSRIWTNKEFEILLHTEQSVYFKTKKMEELDRDAGDIACDLIDVQENVVVNLQTEILQHTETILKVMEICGELDCLIAFSIVSIQHNFCRPLLSENDSEIEIHGAFNPLQTQSVPNDIKFTMSNGKNVRVMVITGPNSCGKTTYMKTFCLTMYMAHIGCFVPARYAKIPIVDAILTRMHSADSISTGLSSFASDLNQVNHAISRATPKSLIAIDEFGKGTQARDGFLLLKSLIAYFAKRGNESPHVMIVTHYNRLANYLQPYAHAILYKTFKVVRDTSKGTIIYEFRMIDGVCESSLADDVALRAGVSQSIILRAAEIRDYISEGRCIQPRAPRAA